MGEFAQGRSRPTWTGSRLGCLFPELAKQADKFSLIRSMTHRNNGHETAAYLMQTGHTPGERLAYPSIGAVFRSVQEPRLQGDDSALRRADAGRRGGSPKKAFWDRSTSPLPPAATPTRRGSRWKASSPAASPTTGRRAGANCSAR